MINKEELMNTTSLPEAIRLCFNIDLENRTCIFTEEAMSGKVAEEYDTLGRNKRKNTYVKIVEDFKRRTGCYGINHPRETFNVGTILEVGCGSGLLTLQIAQQTNSDRIIGVDNSEEMIRLAQDNLSIWLKEQTAQVREFWKKLPKLYQPKLEEQERLEQQTLTQNRINYWCRSVYELDQIGFSTVNYIICRNALHRFKEPEKALKQMYEVLSPQGKIYIRDLRRDANWKTILERIGPERWQTQTLVKDYVGAMARTFTLKELEQMLFSLNINNFTLSKGSYDIPEIKIEETMPEYAEETEYVCVIKK